MADLSTQQRDDLKDKDFAYVDKKGERHLPVHDEGHVRNAAARFSQTHFESKEARHQAAQHVMAAARKFKVDIAEDDAVSEAAESSA